MLLNCVVGEDSWKSLEQQSDPTSSSYRKSVLNIHWKNWCWSWNSSTLATWCKKLTPWKRPSCWKRLNVEGNGDDRGWDGWMASPTQQTWIWAGSGSWWWTKKPSVLQSMGLQRVGHGLVTEQQQQVISSVWSKFFLAETTFLYLSIIYLSSECLSFWGTACVSKFMIKIIV